MPASAAWMCAAGSGAVQTMRELCMLAAANRGRATVLDSWLATVGAAEDCNKLDAVPTVGTQNDRSLSNRGAWGPMDAGLGPCAVNRLIIGVLAASEE